MEQSIQNQELVAHFEVPGEPVSKSRARFTKRGSKTVAYTPQKTKDGEKRVALAYRAAGGRLDPDTEVAYAVHARFLNGTMQRRDVDNMLKLILDGLNGIAYPDDTQVLEVWGRKSKVDKSEARTEVHVYRIGDIGRPTGKCKHCGKDYRTYDSWKNNPQGKKFCSPECSREHGIAKRTRACEKCGESFLAHGSSHSTRFCSKECWSDAGKVTIPCKICGTAFRQYKSWADRRPYCSPECVAENSRRKAQQRRSRSFPGTCLVCGAGTTRKEYQRCSACARSQKPIPA